MCLSILGTWAGDADETWSAARSSILQALVSIQGLVLVKEPYAPNPSSLLLFVDIHGRYFCEPAYDKFRGTEEGIVNRRVSSHSLFLLGITPQKSAI